MTEPAQGREADRLIYAGLLGFAAAGVIQLVEQHALDISLMVAGYGFAVAIPLLAVGLITDYARRAGRPIPASQEMFGLLGVLAAVVGFGAMFFHVGLPFGITFACATVLGVILVRRL